VRDVNKTEAGDVGNKVAERYRARPYRELLSLIDRQEREEVVAGSGVRYQIEVHAVWDDRLRKNIRVFVAVDDGGWSAFSPLVVDFIMAPDGKLVGE
jgi:hypothetical protein